MLIFKWPCLCLDVNARSSGPFGVNAHSWVACLCLDINAQLSGPFSVNAHS